MYGSEVIHDPALPPIQDLHLAVRKQYASEVVIPFIELLVELGKDLNLELPDLARVQEDFVTRR